MEIGPQYLPVEQMNQKTGVVHFPTLMREIFSNGALSSAESLLPHTFVDLETGEVVQHIVSLFSGKF